MRRQLDELGGSRHDARRKRSFPGPDLCRWIRRTNQPGGLRSRPRGRPVSFQREGIAEQESRTPTFGRNLEFLYLYDDRFIRPEPLVNGSW
jgi:hypothetical protein